MLVQAIIAGKPRAGDQAERLKESLRSGRFEAEAFVTLLEQMRRQHDPFGVIAAALHRGRAQDLDVVQVASRVCGANRERLRRSRRDQRGHECGTKQPAGSQPGGPVIFGSVRSGSVQSRHR